MRARAVRRSSLAVVALLALAAGLAGCGGKEGAGDSDQRQVDSVEPPAMGACRVLTPADIAEPTNATRVVDCAEKHTAETFAVGELPAEFGDAGYDSSAVGAFAYQTCSAKFEEFLGSDDSTVMRTIVTWAWFRPSEKAWADGARWYRCDVVGGSEESKSLTALPVTAAGLLATPPVDDAWMVCVNGPSVQAAPKIPCSQKHNWRAVTTIKVGGPDDPYPGDHVVEVKTRDYCSSSVGAWLGYPKDYDYGYTWFHESEWKAGNRRSVCWAATTA